MTALLTVDEAARLVPGEQLVITRPGEWVRNENIGVNVLVAPPKWVALTGPCPTCEAKNGRMIHGHLLHEDLAGLMVICPDCRDGRQIVPLYTECSYAFGTVPGRMPVGRGSIEIFPVAMIVYGPRPYAVYQREDRALVWRGAHPDEVTNRFLGYWPNDKPAPVPGRDFGIVIDCVEVAP